MEGDGPSQFSGDITVPVTCSDMSGTDLTMDRTVVADHATGIGGVLPNRLTIAQLRTDLAGHTFLSDGDLLFRYPLYGPLRTIEKT
jgi:hypothetical protein